MVYSRPLTYNLIALSDIDVLYLMMSHIMATLYNITFHSTLLSNMGGCLLLRTNVKREKNTYNIWLYSPYVYIDTADICNRREHRL